ncbi:MAG TPA: hypothetical protein VGY13_06190 [Solirubrobacteraceae bacterium]|jgi:hypothetical protein|nr:hypothetical protein [Solirubrobacteraceae bacterium]
MRRVGVFGLAVLALAAIAFGGAASASAQAPEYGRCVKKAKAEGSGYTGATCAKEGTGKHAKYEWLAGPGPNAGFSWEGKSIYSERYRRCQRAISEEEVAREERRRAEAAGEPEAAELIKQAEAHETGSRQSYELAGNPGPALTREQCETLIESESARAPAVLQTVPVAIGKKKVSTRVACGGVSATGELSGAKSVADVTITFSECAVRGTVCQSPGAQEGEIVSSALGGELGVVKVVKGKTKLGISLAPAEETPFASFACGEQSVVVSGSTIREVESNHLNKVEPVHYNQSQGAQNPTGFLGAPQDVLSSSIGGAPAEQTGLSLKALQKNEEAVELNTSV